MTRFLVTGASGMVGCRLVERLADRHGKDAVLALTSPFKTGEQDGRRGRLTSLGVEQRPADLLDPEALKDLPAADVVFHLAAELGVGMTDAGERSPMRVNDTGTANLIAALGPGLRGGTFVYSSSIAVVDRDSFGTQRLTEDSPCVPRTLYGRTKLEGERIVAAKARELGFRYCILRLGTVYGPDWRKGHIFDHFTRWARSGALPARIDWPGRISLVYVDDVVDVLMAAGEKEAFAGQVFFLANQEEVTVGGMVRMMAEELGRDLRPIPLPGWLARVLGWAAFQRWFWSRLPGFLAVNAWRLSLIVSDGFYCDSSKLDITYPKGYVGAREGIRRSYHANHAH